MSNALEDVHNFKLGTINKIMECVQNETKLPYWTAVFKLSHFKTWTHFKYKDAQEIGVEVADDLKVFWNQRGKNINSKLKDQITFEQFCVNYQEFLAHVIKNFGNRFDTYEYLDFWALMMINEEIRKKFRPAWLSLVIMLIECPSNCYSEGLGRIGTLTKTSLRNRMSPLLQEFIMLVSESSCDAWTWEAHLDNLVELHVNIIPERACYALPNTGNKNPDKVFHNPLKMPRKNKKRKRKPGDLPSSTENRHKKRCNMVKHQRTVRNLFQNIQSLKRKRKAKSSNKSRKKQKRA